jgi:hypothetical protein
MLETLYRRYGDFGGPPAPSPGWVREQFGDWGVSYIGLSESFNKTNGARVRQLFPEAEVKVIDKLWTYENSNPDFPETGRPE